MRYDELAARYDLDLDDVMAVIARRRWPLYLDAGQVEVVRREADERAEVIAENDLRGGGVGLLVRFFTQTSACIFSCTAIY